MADDAPSLDYWHVWTDDDGVSHQTRATLPEDCFEKESMGGDADPQWNYRFFDGEAEVVYAVQPAGWVGEWHENPAPQWILPISGRWFVETMDGERVEMGPGDLSFGGDQRTEADEDGRKGHRSGTVGDEPAVLMVVQCKDDDLVAARPGDFS